MAEHRSERRARRSVALIAWVLAVTLGLVAGLVVARRLTPERSQAGPVAVVPVPGVGADDGGETARVLLPAGTPRRAAGSAPDARRWSEMRLRIPAIGLDSGVAEGVELTSLASAVGHWPGTALPGRPGNMVLAGHRTTHGAPFRRLDELNVGDEATIGPAGSAVTYRVTGTEIVNPDQLDVARPTVDATATLFACHPPGSARQRIVVRLESSS
ncbi:class E sortase [Candidatus Neomicrothrix sp.]|uniref:class E sortase n=1 Tax=Candidatus Neomicrothrix sp. TaxID=2719034 RepID=UPI002CD1BFCE|nr:class E sortase [Candidatus Microthrix sp.]HMS48658.1 class E sortase [Candidatus Microthrix sp.]